MAANLSRIIIGTTSYDIADVTSRDSINTLQTYFTNEVCNLANGGTGINAKSQKDLLHQLGLAKTVGDRINLDGIRTSGYLTSSKTELGFSIYSPYLIYDVSNVAFSGTYTVRQNDRYLFGSAADQGASVDAYVQNISLRGSGQTKIGSNSFTTDPYKTFFNAIIKTGSPQSAAINNNPCSIVFHTLRIELS